MLYLFLNVKIYVNQNINAKENIPILRNSPSLLLIHVFDTHRFNKIATSKTQFLAKLNFQVLYGLYRLSGNVCFFSSLVWLLVCPMLTCFWIEFCLFCLRGSLLSWSVNVYTELFLNSHPKYVLSYIFVLVFFTQFPWILTLNPIPIPYILGSFFIWSWYF